MATIQSLSVTFAIVTLLPATAIAQQTRNEQLEQQRAERARGVVSQSFLERTLVFVEDKFLLERPIPPAGVIYPKFGGVVVESGLGPGGGYRRSFANDNLRFDVNALFTYREYAVGRVELSVPRLLRRTVEIRGFVQIRHLPEEDFFGLGPDSQVSNRTNYLLDETEYTMQVVWRPRPWLQLGSQHAWLDPRIGRGRDHDFPTLGWRFTDETAPGSTTATTFREHGGLALIDSRDPAGRPRKGGRYVIYASRFVDREHRGLDFSRVAGHVEQYVPIFDGKRVLVLRLGANHLAAVSGGRVPFYYMTPFGGGDSLRGFDDLRFRDTNAWLLTTEYRWEAVSGVDLMVFYDRGGVAPRFKDLSVAGADGAYGVGLRAGTDSAIFFRVEAAFGGREGARWFVGLNTPMRLERFLR